MLVSFISKLSAAAKIPKEGTAVSPRALKKAKVAVIATSDDKSKLMMRRQYINLCCGAFECRGVNSSDAFIANGAKLSGPRARRAKPRPPQPPPVVVVVVNLQKNLQPTTSVEPTTLSSVITSTTVQSTTTQELTTVQVQSSPAQELTTEQSTETQELTTKQLLTTKLIKPPQTTIPFDDDFDDDDDDYKEIINGLIT